MEQLWHKSPIFSNSYKKLAELLIETNRLSEAELLMRRALKIVEDIFGLEHPDVATALNKLAQLMIYTNRMVEAEPLSKRVVEIFINFTRVAGHEHPYLRSAINNYGGLLQKLGWNKEQIMAQLQKIALEMFNKE